MPIQNADVRDYVNKRKQFTTGNKTMYSVTKDDIYIVYSYGEHWPMYIYDAIGREWFSNKDKPMNPNGATSPTTARHTSCARPDQPTTPCSCLYLRDMIIAGSYANHCALRMTTNLEEAA